MQAEPQAEHQWLQKLVGEWTFESECSMGPDQPPMKSTGSETVRSLGGLWTMGEWHNEYEGKPTTMIMTLGYDPARKKFVGTFVGEMMTHLWVYEGELDAAGKVLTLNAEGPDFSGGPNLINYKDVIEFHSDDHRTLTSHMQGPDGQFTKFMSAEFRRQK
jgi:hypothetical protein